MSYFPRLQFAALEKLASSPDGLIAADFTCLFTQVSPQARASRAAELVKSLACRLWVRQSGRRMPDGGRYAVRVWAITDEGLGRLAELQAAGTGEAS